MDHLPLSDIPMLVSTINSFLNHHTLSPSPPHSSFPYTVHVSYSEVTQKKRKFVL